MNEQQEQQERLRDKTYHPKQHDENVTKKGPLKVHHPHATMPFKIAMILVMIAFIYVLFLALQS